MIEVSIWDLFWVIVSWVVVQACGAIMMYELIRNDVLRNNRWQKVFFWVLVVCWVGVIITSALFTAWDLVTFLYKRAILKIKSWRTQK